MKAPSAREEGDDPLDERRQVAGLDPHRALALEPQEAALAGEQRGLQAPAGLALVGELSLPRDHVAVVDEVLAVDRDLGDAAVRVDQQVSLARALEEERA